METQNISPNTQCVVSQGTSEKEKKVLRQQNKCKCKLDFFLKKNENLRIQLWRVSAGTLRWKLRDKDGESDENETSGVLGGDGARCHWGVGACLGEQTVAKGRTAVAESWGPQSLLPPAPVDTSAQRRLHSHLFWLICLESELTFQSPADPPAPLLGASYTRKGHGVTSNNITSM